MANTAANTFSSARSYTRPPATHAVSRLIRDNVVRVGLVLVGMTLFIAAAEAKTPINEVPLNNLPQLVSQIANQSAAADPAPKGQPHVVRQYLTSDDFAATASPRNVINSPAAQFLVSRFK